MAGEAAVVGATVTREQQIARMSAQLDGFLGTDGAWAKSQRRIDALEASHASLDFKALREEMEKIRAGQEQIRDAVRRSRGPGWFPGIEDVQFSIQRALVVAKYGVDKVKEMTGIDCSHEVEVMKAAAQSVGDDKYGGFFVPDQVMPDIIAGVYTRSVMINLVGEGTQRVTVVPNLVGGDIKFPKFLGGLLAYWVGEERAITESAAKVGDVHMNPHKLGVLVRITEALRLLAMPSFEPMLRRDMSRAIAKKLDYAVLYGKGAGGEPRGVINTWGGTGDAAGTGIKAYSAQSKGGAELTTVAALASAPFQADWDGAYLTYDDLSNMKLLVEEDDIDVEPSWAWISAARTFEKLKQTKVDHYSGQTTNQAYLAGAPMMTDQMLSGWIGPYGTSNQIPRTNVPGASIGAPQSGGASKFGDIFGGNWEEVLLGIWAGMQIVDDQGLGAGFASDQTYIKARMWCDVGVRQARGIVVCPDIQITP